MRGDVQKISEILDAQEHRTALAALDAVPAPENFSTWCEECKPRKGFHSIVEWQKHYIEIHGAGRK